LLQTIRIPKNLLFLSDKLPKANYGKNKTNINKNNSFTAKSDNELPNIKNPLNKINNNNAKRKKNEDIIEKKSNNSNNIISEINLKSVNNATNINHDYSELKLIKNQITKKPKNSMSKKYEKNENNYNSINVMENPKLEEIAHVYLDGIYNKKTRSQSPKLDYLLARKQQKTK
jgi:hypothetical protein